MLAITEVNLCEGCEVTCKAIKEQKKRALDYRKAYYTEELRQKYAALLHAIRVANDYELLEDYAFHITENVGVLSLHGVQVAKFIYHAKGFISRVDIYDQARTGEHAQTSLVILTALTLPLKLQLEPCGSQIIVNRREMHWPKGQDIVYHLSPGAKQHQLKFMTA